MDVLLSGEWMTIAERHSRREARRHRNASALAGHIVATPRISLGGTVSSGPRRDQRGTAAAVRALGDATSESVEAVSLVLTGQLGEVMRESARFAVTVAQRTPVAEPGRPWAR